MAALEDELEQFKNGHTKSSGSLLDFKSLFTKVQRNKGGTQYDLPLVKMRVEMIATGAAPSVFNQILFIFAQSVDPDVDVSKLPHLTYLQHLRHKTTMLRPSPLTL